MFHTALQSIYLLCLFAIIAMLVAPVVAYFRAPMSVKDSQMQKCIVTLAKTDRASIEYVTRHIHYLMNTYMVSPDNIVLVAIDSGVKAVLSGSRLQTDIEALLKTGIHIHVCQSTLSKKYRLSAKKPFIKGIQPVADGNKFIDSLMEEGYVASML